MDVKRRKGWMVPLAVLAALMAGTLACGVGSPDLSGFNLQGSYTLEPGEQRTGDQVIVANNVNLRPESAIDGDVSLVANHIQFEGQVSGDVVVIANELVLAGTAQISGDISVCANTFTHDEGARVGGEVTRECSNNERVSAGSVLDSGVNGWRGSLLFRIGSMLASALLSGGTVALAAAIVPQRLGSIAVSIRRSPWTLGGVGCLTIVVAVGLTIAYVISLFIVLPVILLPFVILGWLSFGVLAFLGWAAVASLFGNAALRRAGVDERAPIAVAAVGGVVLSLLINVWHVFWFTGWIGGIIGIVVASIGVGAVVLTRLGSRPYPRAEA